jgi:PAS domain S-box-containing protein
VQRLPLDEIAERERELRRGEEQVRAAFSQAPVGIAIAGRDNRFLDVNQRVCEILGYTRAQLLELTFMDLTHPDDRLATQDQFARLLAGLVPQYSIEKRYVRGDGTTLWVNVTVTVLRDAGGAVDRFIGVIDDISNRKQTEAALRDAQARLEVTLNSAEIGTWTWDIHNDRVIADRNLARMFGFSPATAATGCLEDHLAAMHPEDRPRVRTAIEMAVGPGDGRLEVDYRVMQADGSIRWVAARAQALRNAEGRAVQMPGVLMDVSARKRADDAVRESAQRLQLALAASNLGDWLWNIDDDLMTLSPRAAEIYGVAPDVPVSREQMRVQLLPYDADRARVAADQALRERTDYVIEYQVLRPSGGRRWVSVRGRAFYDADGVVRGMIGVVQDISERREAEALHSRLAAVVESSDDAIISKTLEGNIVTWNYGAQRMFGYRADEVIGKPINILIPEEFLDEEPSTLELLKRGEHIEQYETLRQRKDGTRLNVALTVSPIKDVNGVIVGASKIARDITQQKQLNSALRETDRRKDEFLATLAHELRNPLAPIRQAALISRDPAATELQKRWSHEVISRQVQHMALLLDDLLDISRITRGTLELRTEIVDLAAIVDAAVETARPAIDAHRHDLTIELPREPVRLVADPLRLAQVLSNLLTNAAKYTDPRGQISLRARHVDAVLTLSVRDSGIGIEPEALRSVFAMFSQITSSRARSEGGLGIGLALSKGLVELHGGHIDARSAGSGQGSEFVVTLPVGAIAIAPQIVNAAAPPDSSIVRRVLIADDNRDAADSLAMLLRIDGHDVSVVHDGHAALEALQGVRPDVALLDIGMPGMSGYEIARAARAAPAGHAIMLVAVTGWGQESDKAEAIAAGFDHHFTKPVDPGRLSALLRMDPLGTR